MYTYSLYSEVWLLIIMLMIKTKATYVVVLIKVK